MIAGFFTINMVLSLKGFLQIFDHIVALTGGGPGTDTESVALLIYKGGFQGGEYGYQSANSVVFFIVIVVLVDRPAPIPPATGDDRLMSAQASEAGTVAGPSTDARPTRAPGRRRAARATGQLVADRPAHRPVPDHRRPALLRGRHRPQDPRPAGRHRLRAARPTCGGPTSPTPGGSPTSRARRSTRAIITVGAVVLTLLTNSMVAYAIARNMHRRFFKGDVLLLRLRAVRAVPDHHAAGRQADRAAAAWTTGSA